MPVILFLIIPIPHTEVLQSTCLVHIRKSQNLQIYCGLTLTLLTWRIWWAPNNVSRWQTGFNSEFKGLNYNSCPGWIDSHLYGAPRLATHEVLQVCTLHWGQHWQVKLPDHMTSSSQFSESLRANGGSYITKVWGHFIPSPPTFILQYYLPIQCYIAYAVEKQLLHKLLISLTYQ